MSLKPPSTPKLEGDAEIVRREHEQAIRALQALPGTFSRVIANVVLEDGVEQTVAHGLGRAPVMVIVSPPRFAASAGYICEVRSGNNDRSKLLVLQANGWGATITVDVEVK